MDEASDCPDDILVNELDDNDSVAIPINKCNLKIRAIQKMIPLTIRSSARSFPVSRN